ncbi:Protocadherin Fat 1, partial [Araneus ventricosus]
CNCGPYGSCSFEYDIKRCNCKSFAVEKNGVCVDKGPSSSEGTTDSTTTSTIGSSTVQACDCGLGGSCQLDSSGEKICNCFSGYARYKGHCYECDCGSYGTCILESGIKRCTCDVNFAEKNGKCEYCSCGENSKFCRYNVLGEKECSCSSAYAQNRGYCEECNCGPYGSCSFEYDRKRCHCKSFAVEKNGVCVVMESTTLEGSTSTRTTVLTSTTQCKV